MMNYWNKPGCAFGRKPGTSGINRIRRFQSAASLGVLWENLVSWGKINPASWLEKWLFPDGSRTINILHPGSENNGSLLRFANFH